MKDSATSLESDQLTQPRLALDDLVATVALRQLWLRLAWNDILHRYRRSILGPLWFTLSTAIMVVALGVVYSELFQIRLSEFMPYVCVSLLIWGFISSILSDAGELFARAESSIKQIRLPYLLYVCRFMWGNVIILAHNFTIYLIVIAWFGAWPGAVALFTAPAFVLLAFNGALASLTLGMTSARFRDVPRITASAVQVLFLITPILWTPAMLGSRSWLVDLNPFFHLIEIMRAPLLGRLPASQTVWIVLAITVLNLLVAAGLFSRYRSRIAYWV